MRVESTCSNSWICCRSWPGYLRINLSLFFFVNLMSRVKESFFKGSSGSFAHRGEGDGELLGRSQSMLLLSCGRGTITPVTETSQREVRLPHRRREDPGRKRIVGEN